MVKQELPRLQEKPKPQFHPLNWHSSVRKEKVQALCYAFGFHLKSETS